MNEKKTTFMFAGVALGLLLLALITTPSRVTPDAFLDQGEPFYPEFNDPNEAQSLEVIRWDEETGEAIPFKVVFADGRWSIPSHNNYPADGADRLAKTAAGAIGINKDDYRSDNVSDWEACGVIDPLDESATSLTGRGERVTIRGANDKVLADYIIGNKIEGREGFRFMRIPDQKRIYAVRTDFEVSTTFSDWIEADLLKIPSQGDITDITIKDYRVNERQGRINERDVITLNRNGADWNVNRTPGSKESDNTKITNLLKAIDELSIVGVRPKPKGLSASLKRESSESSMEMGDLLSLQSKGYYMVEGRGLFSNEGEIQVETQNGVQYTLRFGEVAYGTGAEVSAGTGEANTTGPAENRYLFVTTSFLNDRFKEPRKPANTDFQGKPDSLLTAADQANKELYTAHQAWNDQVLMGQKAADELNDRFANWYYVISDENFKKMKLNRSDLLKDKS
ncbi:MAG: DUF4340 domain-containing protein [Calditrichota bacterium]